jgi:hypothetical protein
VDFPKTLQSEDKLESKTKIYAPSGPSNPRHARDFVAPSILTTPKTRATARQGPRNSAVLQKVQK